MELFEEIVYKPVELPKVSIYQTEGFFETARLAQKVAGEKRQKSNRI